MVLSPETEQFLEQLDRLSNNSLIHRNEVGVVLELSRRNKQQAPLAELAFGAKFCWNTYSMLKRIGPGAEGYEQVMSEFQQNAVETLSLLTVILRDATDDVRTLFEGKFFISTQESIQAQIELFRDISWIKNWTIDHRSETPV